MKIRVLEDDTGFAPAAERFNAIDDDRYDGAPDGCTMIGRGATPNEAIADLLKQLPYDCGGYGCGHQPCICDPL